MKFQAALLSILALVTTLRVSAAPLNFNLCRDLPKAEREDCLFKLSLSYELSNLNQSRENWKASIVLRHGMLTDGDSYNNVGQWFVSSITPRAAYISTSNIEYSFSLPFTKAIDTGAKSQASYSVGRPELTSLFPIMNGSIAWSVGAGIRLPLRVSDEKGSWKKSESGSVWQISAQSRLQSNLPVAWSIGLDSRILYNSDYTYSETIAGTNNSGSFNFMSSVLIQHPVVTRNHFFVKKSGLQSYLGGGFLAQYGFTGHQTRTTDAGLSTKTDLPGGQMTSIDFFYGKQFRAFTFEAMVSKSLKYDGAATYDYVDLDDQTFAADIALQLNFSKHF